MGFIAVTESTKRIIVMVIAAAMTVIAIMNLINTSEDVFAIVVNSLMLIGTAGGALGAYKMNSRWLGWFLIVVFCLIILQAISLILALTAHAGFHSFLWNIVDLFLLFVLAGFVTDLRADAGGLLGGYTAI